MAAYSEMASVTVPRQLGLSKKRKSKNIKIQLTGKQIQPPKYDVFNKPVWGGVDERRERNEDRGGGKTGTENGMDKKPGQGTARIWLNGYCKELV